jgi:transposase
MYPTRCQNTALLHMLGMHQRLYNAALDQRITAYRQTFTSVGFVDQCKDLTELRTDDKTYAELNAQSSQVTLKRLTLAFDAFFRRCISYPEIVLIADSTRFFDALYTVEYTVRRHKLCGKHV